MTAVFSTLLSRDFPRGPVVKIPHFHHRRCGFDPWLGNEDPACLTMAPIKKKKNPSKITTPLLSRTFWCFRLVG